MTERRRLVSLGIPAGLDDELQAAAALRNTTRAGMLIEGAELLLEVEAHAATLHVTPAEMISFMRSDVLPAKGGAASGPQRAWLAALQSHVARRRRQLAGALG